MKRLTIQELVNLKDLNNEALLNMLEHWSDHKYVNSIRHANGIPNKGLSDPDVQKLHDDYDTIRKEVEIRLKAKGISVLNLDYLLDITNQIALDSAGKGWMKGVPLSTLSDNELKQVKDDFNTVRGSIEFNLGT